VTDRLYYRDSFLYDFDAEVREVLVSPRPALILDCTAFYPTSGGQIFDTGSISSDASAKLRVIEVADAEDGRVVHYLEAPPGDLKAGSRVHGQIDASRRRDHMQQHSGQHVLSAAFLRLYNLPTISFHMADDYCSIDLDTPALTKEQIEAAERLANEIILENRTVDIRFVSWDEAEKLGLRKLPPTERDELRLIDIRDFDLTACGGTHVAQTGQIASILLRKIEKVRQGWRVEFVAGLRAVATARRDFTTLSETAALFSAHIYDVPQLARKALDEIKLLRKQHEQSQEELAAAYAAVLLADAPEANGLRIVVRTLRARSELRETTGAEIDSTISGSSSSSFGNDIAATLARLRAICRSALRHGSADETDHDEDRRTRRRQQGSSARRHSECRWNRGHSQGRCRDAPRLNARRR
jgi:alanyl-tRNA synthetase